MSFYHWLTTTVWGGFTLGVVGNLVASLLLAGAIWKQHGRRIREHFAHVRDLHRHHFGSHQ